MQTLINLCGKYRKWIYSVLTAVILLLLCFPVRKIYAGADIQTGTYLYEQHPYFLRAFYWITSAKNYSLIEPVYRSDFWFELFSFIALILFISTLILFWVREARGKKGLFSLPLLFAFISHFLLLFSVGLYPNETEAHIIFITNATFYLFIVLICLYTFAILFGKLYPRMQPKLAEVSENVGKVVDKVKSHKSKSERIEELERQNAEIQKQLDELKRKD